MKTPKFLLPVATAGVLALTLSACGGGGGGGTTAGADAEQGLDGRGPITYVQGKDNNNVVRPVIEKWNAAHPNEKVTFKEQTDQADQQHDDLVQNFQAKNANYDVVSVDVVWTAEFAAKGWLQPLKDKMAMDTSAMLKPTVDAASYKGTLYAIPKDSDGGMLYYRKDLVPTPPKTWDEMMGMCSIAKENNIGCFAGQYAKYEGLTVNTAEAINSAGGSVLDADGKPSLTTPEAKAGLGTSPRHMPTATSRRKPSRSRRSRAARPSRTASCSSTATGRTCTAWQRLKGLRKSKTSSAWRRCPALTAPGHQRSADIVSA